MPYPATRYMDLLAFRSAEVEYLVTTKWELDSGVIVVAF